MKMQLIKLITTIVVLGSFVNIANADWLSDVAGSMESNSPAKYETQGGTYYSGGGYKFSVPDDTINFFSAKGPSISAGCNGIDVDWGGFKHISGDDIIKFLKQVVANSTGYAFNLAMQTLCPQCTDLMNTLGEAANMLNGLDLDSCEVAQAAVNFGGDVVGAAATKMGIPDGGTNSFNDNVKKVNTSIKGLLDEIDKMVDDICVDELFTTGSFKCPKMFFKGEATFLQTIFARSKKMKKLHMANGSDDHSKEKGDMINLIRAFTGDISLNINEEDETIGVVYSPSIHANNKSNLEKTINYWIIGKKDTHASTLLDEGYNIDDDAGLHISLEGKDNKNTSRYIAMQSFVSTSVINILDIEKAFNTRNPLSGDNLRFLSSFKSPVYKILNTSSSNPALFKSFIDSFKILAGVQLAYETISLITQEVLVNLALLEVEVKKYDLINNDRALLTGIATMRRVLRDMNEYSYSLYAEAYESYNNRNMSLDGLEIIKRNMQAQLSRHPVFSAKATELGVTR